MQSKDFCRYAATKFIFLTLSKTNCQAQIKLNPKRKNFRTCFHPKTAANGVRPDFLLAF